MVIVYGSDYSKIDDKARLLIDKSLQRQQLRFIYRNHGVTPDSQSIGIDGTISQCG